MDTNTKGSEACEDTDTHGGKTSDDGDCDWSEDLQAKDWRSDLKLRRGQEHSPQERLGSLALPTPGFWTPSLQNCEPIEFCCFQLLSLQAFVPAALGHSYTQEANDEFEVKERVLKDRSDVSRFQKIHSAAE